MVVAATGRQWQRQRRRRSGGSSDGDPFGEEGGGGGGQGGDEEFDKSLGDFDRQMGKEQDEISRSGGGPAADSGTSSEGGAGGGGAAGEAGGEGGGQGGGEGGQAGGDGSQSGQAGGATGGGGEEGAAIRDLGPDAQTVATCKAATIRTEWRGSFVKPPRKRTTRSYAPRFGTNITSTRS